MKFKFNLKREIKIGAAILVVLLLIGFTERRQAHISIKDISIRMENINENHFLDESDIQNLMQLSKENLKGASISKVNLKGIEKKIMSDPFIQDAELYSDLKGNVVARVELRRPIARIVRNDGPDGYIAEDGTLMPTSDRFTPRVVLISGGYVRKLLQQDNVNQTPEGKQLMELINRIREDEFWSAQVAQLDIDSKLNVTIYPQVGDEQIEFGKPDNQEVKFTKLMIYYKEILPRVGWNKYNRVNLQYEGQIVAE
jgi:cell division protein FtsQ